MGVLEERPDEWTRKVAEFKKRTFPVNQNEEDNQVNSSVTTGSSDVYKNISVKEEVAQMGGPVLLSTVYDAVIGRMHDTNQEIRTELSELEQKVAFISVDRPKLPEAAKAAQEPQSFPDTDLSISLKNLLSQSDEILDRIRSISSGIVS